GANPGAVPMMGAFETGESLKIRLAPGLPDNYEVIIKVSYLDPANAYVDFEYFSFFVNRSWINLEANQIHTSITSSGNFGYHDFPYNQEGEGLRFRDQSNVLFEGGLLIGKSISQVSDNIRNTNGRDQDFAVQQAIAFVENPTKADVEAISVFRDNVSANPIGVEITQHIYAFEDQERENFVLMEYSIKNESAAPLANLYGGLFADWDILAALANRNVANYDDTSRLVFAYDFTGVNPNYYGIGLVSDDNFYAEAGRTNYFPFTSSGKFGALVNAPSPSTATQGATTGGTDIFQFISSGPISLAPQAQDTLVFALLAGQNYTQLEQAQEAAKNSYECRILAKGPLEAFTISDAFAKVGESVSFQDQNSQASSWQWDFGDGFTSDQANPSHTYALAGVYTVTLTVSDGYCEETTAQTVYIDFATDLEDLTQQLNWSLYPNPTQGQLSVRMSGHWTGTFSWRLLDMQGREIWRESARKGQLEEQYQISLPSLPAGLYQFVWQGPQGKKVHPLMVR
ncbi:MAG: PKD domain-containing protein, partial [Bacteroidota bacterium]